MTLVAEEHRRGQADDLMGEIPTVVVQPLPPKWRQVAAGYAVLDRPYAFQQWVRPKT